MAEPMSKYVKISKPTITMNGSSAHINGHVEEPGLQEGGELISMVHQLTLKHRLLTTSDHTNQKVVEFKHPKELEVRSVHSEQSKLESSFIESQILGEDIGVVFSSLFFSK